MYSSHTPAKHLLLKAVAKELTYKFSSIQTGSYNFSTDKLGFVIIEGSWTPFITHKQHVYIKEKTNWELKRDLLEPIKYFEITPNN